MKLKEIRERLREGGRLHVIRLPEVPKGAFKLRNGSTGFVMGDINNPGMMYIEVIEDITEYNTDSHQQWLAEVISEASLALDLRVPRMSVTCATHLDIEGELDEGTERIEGRLNISGGPTLYTSISAAPKQATLTLPNLDRYASQSRAPKSCMCGERPSIGIFDLGKKRSSTATRIPFSSYTLASGKIVKPGDKRVPLCARCVRKLESNDFTTAHCENVL